MADPHHLDRRELLYRTAGSVIVAIAIPLIFSLAEGKGGLPLLDAFEGFVVGSFIFVTTALAQLTYELGQLAQIRRGEAALWSTKNDVDTVLGDIRIDYAQIVDRGTDGGNLFAMYFADAVKELATQVHEAATKQELMVNELTIGATELLMRAMEVGGPHDVLLVHQLDERPNNFDCSTWARAYYRSLTDLATRKKVSVRRVFVYSSDVELADPLTQLLFQYHANNPGYEYRIIRRTDWSNILQGYGLPGAQNEIGVWGENLAYSTHQSSATRMEGAYTSSPQRIALYTSVHSAGWDLATAPSAPSSRKRVSTDELFELAAKQQMPPT